MVLQSYTYQVAFRSCFYCFFQLQITEIPLKYPQKNCLKGRDLLVCITSQIPEKFKSTCTSDAARPRVSSFSGLVFCHLQALRHPTSPPPRGHGRSVLMCGSLTTATWRQQFQLMSYPFHKQRDPVLPTQTSGLNLNGSAQVMDPSLNQSPDVPFWLARSVTMPPLAECGEGVILQGKKWVSVIKRRGSGCQVFSKNKCPLQL